MITQIFGVALISLLNITPTLQQNNIEQLIAPNIEIQDNIMNTVEPNRLWVANQFSYYRTSQQLQTYTDSLLFTNFDWYNQDSYWTYRPVTESDYPKHLFIQDNNFYITLSNNQATGNFMRDLIQGYYSRTRSATVTSSSFSFQVNSSLIGKSQTFYTYTVNGTNGSMTGRFYNATLSEIQNLSSISLQNNNISIPSGATLQQVIQTLNPQITWSYSDNRYDQKILYYHINSPLPLTTQGTYTRNLYGLDNYGHMRTFGSFNITILPPDLTNPTITSINGNSTNWTNQDITLTVQATDNVALNSTAYSFDNGVTYQSSNSKTFTTNEIVNIRVRDSSDNYSSQTVTINRIDKQSPAIVLAGNWVNTFELGELESNNDLYNYLSISDGASGINSSLTTISNFNYNQAGTYTNVQVSATDNAGNTFVYTLPTITITQPLDTTPPTISGSTVQTRVYGTVTTQGLLDSFTISDPSGIDEVRIQKLDNTIVTSWNDFNVGSYQLRLYARDIVGNIALYQFELVITAPPAPDLTPPVITGSLMISTVLGTYTNTSEILALYTITDNVEVAIQQLIGTIDFDTPGDYQVTISATDTSNNTSTRNIVVRIRSQLSLDGYNPITDLLSGIFGGVLSLIFTIGTINLLGFRLLDAMAIIILGGVIYLVYKAIRK
jgi:hypothetical protein